MDLNVGIEASSPGNTCATTVNSIKTVPILVNSGGNAGPRFIKNVTVTAAKCNSAGTNGVDPTDSIRYSSEYGSLENLLVEQGTTLGLRLGADGPVNSVTITNVTSGPAIGNGTTPTCHSISGTTAVWLDSANPPTNTTLLSTGDVPNTGNATYIIVDCNNLVKGKAYTIPFTTAGHAVTHYVLSGTGKNIITTDTGFATFPSGMQLGLNTPPATSAVLDVTAGNIQQIACPSSGGIVTVTPTVPTVLPGMEMTLIFIQGPSLSNFCSIAYPSIMHGGSAAPTGYGSVSTQKFIVSNNGTDLYAEGPASVCTSSCGTP